jgi:DNA-binding cell septation regulator SpoVG
MAKEKDYVVVTFKYSFVNDEIEVLNGQYGMRSSVDTTMTQGGADKRISVAPGNINRSSSFDTLLTQLGNKINNKEGL